jgi:cytochrome c
MNTFEINKVAGGVLSALLVIFASKTLMDIAAHEHKPEKPGWALPITDTAVSASAAPAKPFDPAEVMGLLSKASAESRKVGTEGGFPYSEAMKTHGGEWTFQNLAAYLHDPKAAVPGNKMAFAGVKDSAELADLLA